MPFLFALAFWGFRRLLWTRIGYYPPVPFSGFIGGYGVAMSQFFAIWFIFDKEWRKITEFRKRMKYFLTALGLSQILTIEYNVLAKFLFEYKDNNVE